MQVNVAQQLKESTGSVRRYMFEEEEQRLSDDLRHDYRGEALFLRTDKGILVTASLETIVLGICSRCLVPSSYPLKVVLAEEYFPIVNVLTGVPLPTPPVDAFTIDRHHLLDLREAVRQYTLLNMPMKPLCKSDCAGLCPRCGANLNEAYCACPREEVDPRWAALLQLHLDKG